MLQVPKIVDDVPALPGREGVPLAGHQRAAIPDRGVEEPIGALPEELRGLGFKDAARGPSPFPVAPWHEKQRTTENRQLIP